VGGELSKAKKIPKDRRIPGYGKVSENEKAPEMGKTRKKVKVRFRHTFTIAIVIFITVFGAIGHYSVSGDILILIIEIVLLVPLEIFMWSIWIRRDTLSEEKVEEFRSERFAEYDLDREKPLEAEMIFPIKKKYMALSLVISMTLLLFLYFTREDILFLIMFFAMLPLVIVGMIGLYITGKMVFKIDPLGIRRSRVFLKDFYLPWYNIKKVTIKDISNPITFHGRKNYVIMAVTDKGREPILISSVAVKDEKFMELYYGIIPFLKNRKIELEDELGWAK
jgi:hypothetical protein